MPKRKIRRAGNPVGRMTRPGHWLRCGSGNTGPQVRVVQVSGGCFYDQCVEAPTVRATSCDSTIRLVAYDYRFTNTPDQFTWGQSGGIVSAGGGVGDDFIEIDTTSGVNVSISVTLTATDSVSGDSASCSVVQIARHTDITQPALFIGPDINDVVFTEGVDIGIFSFRPVFGGCFADDFAVATGTLPDGLTLSSLGLLTGTPTTPGTAQGLSVSMTSAGGVAVTNTFNMTVQDVDAPSVLIVRDTVGACNINPPSTTCIAVGTYAVTNANFTNPPTSFVWSISTNPGGVAIISGQGTDTVEVQSSGGANVTFTLKCVVTDFLSGDTAENVDQITHVHSDVVLPDFWALTPDPDTNEMLGVRIGVGGLTTTHAQPIYAKDYEDVYRAFGANAPVYSGGRVVTNRFQFSEDLSNASWLYSGPGGLEAVYVGIAPVTGPNGEVAHEILLKASVNSRVVQVNSSVIDRINCCSFYVREKTGTGAIRIRVNAYQSPDIATNEDWKRVSASSFQSIIQDGLGNSNAGLEHTVYVCSPQTEDMSGMADTTTPSEYVQTTTVPATKVFASTNGNTVTDNVVTEAVGTPLAEMPYLSTGYNEDTGTTPATGTTNVFDSLNHQNVSGAYYCEVRTIDADPLINGFLAVVGTNFELSDGTTQVTGAWVTGTSAKVGISYGESQMAINVDGVWSIDVAYDGTLLSGLLNVMQGNSSHCEVRNLRRYDIAIYAEGKTIIDDLMS